MIIYLTTNNINGKKYIGLDTRNNPNYYGSGTLITMALKKYGRKNFTKEILAFISKKGMMLYAEELALYLVGALESDNWINQNIRSKIYHNWVLPDEAKVLRERIKELIL